MDKGSEKLLNKSIQDNEDASNAIAYIDNNEIIEQINYN